MISTTLLTPPASEPVSLAEAKAHLRITHDDENALISTLITAARQAAEDYTKRVFITQSWRLWLDEANLAHNIKLPHPPLIGISSVTLYRADSSSFTLPPAHYHANNAAIPGQFTLQNSASWPSGLRRTQSVAIDYTAGYGLAGHNVPAPLRTGMLHHIATLYDQRDSVRNQSQTANNAPPALPDVSRSLYHPYRLIQVAA